MFFGMVGKTCVTSKHLQQMCEPRGNNAAPTRPTVDQISSTQTHYTRNSLHARTVHTEELGEAAATPDCVPEAIILSSVDER